MGQDDVDQRTRRWQRLGRVATDVTDTDPVQALRIAIREVRARPRDSEARRRLRAVAAEQGMWAELAPLLADEARAASAQPQVAAAFYEELADVHENLDQPLETIAAMEAIIALEPTAIDRHDRLAWLYRRAGAWSKAAAAYETVASLGSDDRAHTALRAAARLYRDNGRAEHAANTYRAIVDRRPTDLDAWRALDELYGELRRWRELSEVRGELVARADNGVDKAAALRAQARAVEQTGDASGAAELVARAAGHAPEDLSGLVDYVSVLARAGKGREAAALLVERVTEATARGAGVDELAALRSRLAGILEDACGDRPAAATVLEELLAAKPDHLPALERLVWQASHDPDPRVHAIALVRQAAALPEHDDKLAAITQAARCFRDARDHRAAVRAFEKAVELAPGDAALAGELEATRTTLVVETARSEVGNGTRGAEQKLRAIIATQPRNLDANLALAEVLVATGRLDAAAEHLRETLEAAEGDDDKRLAVVVHRYALVMTALGDPDEAHTLLHEAHRLHRRDLVITLALGESCFARKLWREASLHLGSLAEHPDVAAHATAVATGLVHAALAEIRGLRPANAPKHFDAALRLDPNCAPALHALAEQAIERGDTVRAAELLEREATVTTEPDKRLRLFDALGDLAHDVLDDRARAERCWRLATAGELGIEHVPVLDKLLAVQRTLGLDGERGETCARLASITASEPRKRELTIEAVDAFAASGDLARARELAEQLVATHALDEAAVGCASAIALALGDSETAKAWLRRALTAWDASGDRGTGNPRRADLWRRLGDAERARGNERAALAAYQRSVATAPDSPGALGARRGLVELAVSTGASVATSLAALVEAEQDPDEALAWARGLASRRSGKLDDNLDDARAAFELATALGAPLTAEDEGFLTNQPVRPMASDQAYGTALEDAELRAIVDDPADVPLGELLEMLWEVAAQVCPSPQNALVDADLADAKRLSAVSDAAVAAIYPQIAKALGGPPTLVHTTTRQAEVDLQVLFASPPVIVVGPRLANVRARTALEAEANTDAALRFRLGRIVELARPRRIFTAAGPDAFARLVATIVRAFGPPSTAPATPDPDLAREAEKLRAALPVALRKRLTERLAVPRDHDALDIPAYLAACERAADRAGLLACGHVDIAIELAGGPAAVPHLVQLASSPKYLAARRKLRPRR